MKGFQSSAETSDVAPIVVNIGSAVKSAREAARYSLEDLAVTCGLTVGEIVQIEQGEDTDPARVKRVSIALKI
ncbi:hypothetical protein NGR_b16500 (plasmid) [Sinorhizobium fredii NGR234]|uniref:HTH cro/C1-type domain-containing protein n=1 Tax=Sinorhizobium fredii (strain NBRC 101917 / NGR234) TaxID=394 RepID=Q6W1Z8_SINFN|nr:helix-turn-helix domain-containing protein [Sinorhizobium fredii]AAQ87220.1 Hypothetical protein RNGR00198 [Sinorhizobium fredii NGR234]ACP23101.1 hypothetical protein NGR_b16500 [Sinorhizobium fredii NGR234]